MKVLSPTLTVFERVKVILPFEEKDLEQTWKYAIFKKWVQAQVPELNISSISHVHCPWYRDPWKSIWVMFRVVHDRFRLKVLTWSLGTHRIELLVNHRVGVKVNGEIKEEQMSQAKIINKIPGDFSDITGLIH